MLILRKREKNNVQLYKLHILTDIHYENFLEHKENSCNLVTTTMGHKIQITIQYTPYLSCLKQ